MSERVWNPKLIATFAIPVGLVFLALVASKKYVDVFESPSNLEPRVAHARKIGLPFSADELRATMTSRPEGKFEVEFRNSLKNRNNQFDVDDPNLLSAESIEARYTHMMESAYRFASTTSLQDSRDFDSWESADVYGLPRQSTKLLVLKARYQALHDDPDGAIETLALIPNLFKQIRQDPHIMGLLVNSGLQIEFCRGISEVSAQFGNDRAAQQKLLDLVNLDWSTQPLKHALKGEFYMQLKMLRNELPLVLYTINPALATGEEPKLDPNRPIQKTGLPSTAVGQGFLAQLIDYYSEVFQVLTEADPATHGAQLEQIAKKFDDTSLGSRFVAEIADNATSACRVYSRQSSWKAITRWAIEIHRDYGKKFPASLPSKIDPGLGGQLQYRRTDTGFKIFSFGEDGADDQLPSLEAGGMDMDDFGIEYPRVPYKYR